MTAEASPRPARSFRIVALVFLALLAVGLAAAFVVYKKYVAYEPTVANHVPASARVAVRFDLTHVMFYEPFRRSVFPLADRFAQGQSARRARLEARGIRVNSDVRELLGVLGPGPGDWAVVVGGRMPRGSIGAGVAAVLAEEGRRLTENAGTYSLPDTGLAFAETADGSFAIASSLTTLASVVAVGVPNEALSSGSGGIVVRPGALPGAPAGLTATFRAGSVVEIRGRAEVDDTALAEQNLRSLLALFAGSDPAALSAIRSVEFSKEASGLGFRLALPREAVLGIVEALAQRVPG